MRLSILWKLVVPIVLVVSLLATGLLWVQLRSLNEAFHRRGYGWIAIATEIVNAQQRHLEEQTSHVTRELALRPQIRTDLLERNQRDAADILSVTASAADLPTLTLLDAQGRLFAAAWTVPRGPIPAQIAALASRGLAGASVVGPASSWRSPGEVAIVAVTPVRVKTQVGGVVIAESLMGNAFVDEVKRLTLLDTGIFLGDRRVATTVLGKDGQRLMETKAVTRNAHRVLTQGQMITDEVIFGGQRYIARYLPLRSPAGPIIGMLVVGAPSDASAGDRRNLIGAAIVASLIALGLACGVTVCIGYRMLMPIRRLRNSVEAIRHGTPEKADFPGIAHDEIQELSVAMSDMVQQLQARERDLAEANAALREAGQHKSEFLARMSHELRTPLNAIIGFSELLLERVAGDLTPKQDEYLRDIHSSGAHLLTVINEILDLSKIETGRMELTFDETNLAEVVESAFMALRPRIERKRLDVSAALDPTITTIRADKVRLKQIVCNLLSNAARFTPENGKIRVEARRVNEDVELAVVDTGPGMRPEDQANLFRDFTQLKAAQESGQAGAGLGLVLVKRLVDLHGGRVWVESEVGSGSRFVVRFPIGTQTAPPPNGPGPILVVEDDPAIRRLFTHYLTEAGYRTEGIGDGPGVIGKVKAVDPSVICLDIRLPGVEDWEVLRRLKEDPATAPIPIVVTTVLDDPRTAFALGAAAFLVKPVGRNELLEAVGQAVQIPPGATPTVLVVDDDPHALEMVTPVLEQAGYKVLIAANGQEGIQQARQHLPHLIMLDLLMPKVNGFDVVSTLRGDVRTRGIPIIVLTAKDLTSAEWADLNGRVQGIRLKGVTLGQALVEEVKRVLASREVGGR